VGKLPKQTKRRDLIKRFRELGWGGPHSGAKGDHPEYMAKGNRIVKVPNPHRGDIGEGLLKKIIAEAGLSAEKWLGDEPADKPESEGGDTAQPAP
jgi:predicted RNA binding protein YcfA (HicA-like mRNA interferase family)